MNEERQQKLRGHIGRGLLVSFLAHASVVLPVIALAVVFGQPAEPDLDVSFEEVSEADLPPDLPPLSPDEPADRLPRPLAERPLSTELDPVPPPEKREEERAEQKPDEPRPVEKRHAKIVDLDLGQDVEPPPDAKYLAQKNNRAREETRATDTNLERAQEGGEASSPSDRRDDKSGDPDDKIAELEDRRSQRGRSAPQVTPHLDPQSARQAQGGKSLLSMREAPQRQHDVTPETADPSLPRPRDPEGVRAAPWERPEAVRDLAPAGESRQPRLSLSGDQFEYLFGEDAEAARRLAQTERSRRRGRFAQRQDRIKSALENFIPEVRPGNQTALNTRAAPFAVFIARMHRNIHKLWGFGFLEDLDSKPSSSPFNNRDLVTRLEIVLDGDGTVDKVMMLKTSGYLPYDVAAIDVVYSAGPFPDPPREIRSGNGKIYVHWSFHRDERQCATFGADYYILDNAPAGGDKGEPEASRGLPEPTPSPRLRRLTREVPNSPAHRAKMRELDEAAGEEPDPEAARRADREVVRSDDPAARAVADDWFTAHARGDVDRMLRHAIFPFRSSQGVAAKAAPELRAMLKALMDESPSSRTVRALRVYSPAGARGALGDLPAGFDGPGLLFAVGQVAKEDFVLLLVRHGESWKAAGLLRR